MDPREEGRLGLDWRVLEKVYCKHKILYILYIHIYIGYYYSIYNFYANEFLSLLIKKKKKGHHEGTTLLNLEILGLL